MSNCPTPWKLGYKTRGEARVTARGHFSQPNKRGQVKPYLCPCGSWHLSSMSKRAHKLVTRRRT